MYGFEAKGYKNDSSWKKLKFFNEDKAIFGKKLLNKNTFEKLINLDKLIIKFDQIGGVRNLAKSGLEIGDTEILTVISGSDFFIKLFIDEWYGIGGSHKVIKDEKYIQMNFIRDKKNNFDNSLLLYLKGILKADNKKRLFIVADKVKKIDELKQFDNDKSKVITTEILDEIIDAVWKKKKETNKEIKREKIAQLYTNLVKMIDEKMQDSSDWIEAREKSKSFRSFDSSMLSKYDK